MKIFRRSSQDDSQVPLQLSLDDSFEYRVKRQRRKTLALHVLADGVVEVRAPGWVPRAEIAAFVESRSEWVVAQRRQVLEKLAQRPRFVSGHEHDYLGQKYPLQVSPGRNPRVAIQDGVLRVELASKPDPGAVERALMRWYRRRAEAVFEERLFASFERFPDWFQDRYTMPELKIRKMRRRWGSCSSRGVITLNVSMIRLPIDCIDYIICHELAHLEVFNHSKAFYRLLAQVVPDWRELEVDIDRLGDLY